MGGRRTWQYILYSCIINIYLAGIGRATTPHALCFACPLFQNRSLYILGLFFAIAVLERGRPERRTLLLTTAVPRTVFGRQGQRDVCIALIYGCIDHRNDGFKQARKLCTQTEVTQRR